MNKRESHIRSLLKGLSWRVIATSDTILIVLLITCWLGECRLETALKIGIIELFIKLAVYYFHERIWQNIGFKNKVTKQKTLYKTISWRIIATTVTFLISGAILKSFNEVALFIALTELITKFALYYLHERVWLKIPIGRINKFFLKTLKR